MLIDTHCHLNYLHGLDIDALRCTLKEASSVEVDHCICIGVDLLQLHEVLTIAETFEQVSATIGVHPCSVSEQPFVEAMATLYKYIQHPEVVAVGECGLDYFREEGLDKAIQKQFFSGQVELALTHEKPLVVHTRHAREDTIDLLRSVGRHKAQGVLHCFTETKEMASKALDLGFYISFSGIITFKNAEELRDVVRYVPLDRMLVETDSPYLAPVPFRGKQNQPAYVVEVAKKVAELKSVPFARVCKQTTDNARALFGWPCG